MQRPLIMENQSSDKNAQMTALNPVLTLVISAALVAKGGEQTFAVIPMKVGFTDNSTNGYGIFIKRLPTRSFKNIEALRHAKYSLPPDRNKACPSSENGSKLVSLSTIIVYYVSEDICLAHIPCSLKPGCDFFCNTCRDQDSFCIRCCP